MAMISMTEFWNKFSVQQHDEWISVRTLIGLTRFIEKELWEHAACNIQTCDSGYSAIQVSEPDVKKGKMRVFAAARFLKSFQLSFYGPITWQPGANTLLAEFVVELISIWTGHNSPMQTQGLFCQAI